MDASPNKNVVKINNAASPSVKVKKTKNKKMYAAPSSHAHFCSVCQLNVHKAKVVEHLVGANHRTNANNTYTDSRVIEVQGMGRNVSLEEAKLFFNCFGKVDELSDLQWSLLRVKFNRAADVKPLLNPTQTIMYRGNKLLMWAASEKVGESGTKKPNHVNHPPVQKAQKPVKIKRYFAYMDIPEAVNMDLRGDFSSQLETLMVNVRLTVADMERFRVVCSDLQSALSSSFPGCQVLPFGSVVTGLGFIGSDIDCFGYLPGIDFETNKNKIFKLAKAAFYRNSHIFKEIVPILHTKVPIIKLKHHPCTVSIDINFKSPDGVLNSELIRSFLKSDERILPLAIFIKYWAKSMGFICIDKRGFTSYGVTLLVIFYLQRLSNPMLPPVCTLQTNAQLKSFVGKWHAGFNGNNLPKNKNTLSLLSLIEGFFQFYSDFEYKNVVISPFIGDSLPFANVKNLTNLPPEFNQFVQYVRGKSVDNLPESPIILQDPIKLDVNCSKAVSLEVLEEFANECFNSAYLMRKVLSSSNQNNLIQKLTNFCKVVPDVDAKEPLSFCLPLRLKDDIKMMTAQNLQLLSNNLKNHLRSTVTSVLAIFRCKHTFKEVKVNNDYSLQFDCDISYDFWSKRDSYRVMNGLHTVKQESDISESMYKRLLDTDPTFTLSNPMRFQLAVRGNVQQCLCAIDITPLNYANDDFYNCLDLFLFILECWIRQFTLG